MAVGNKFIWNSSGDGVELVFISAVFVKCIEAIRFGPKGRRDGSHKVGEIQ